MATEGKEVRRSHALTFVVQERRTSPELIEQRGEWRDDVRCETSAEAWADLDRTLDYWGDRAGTYRVVARRTTTTDTLIEREA